MQPPFASNHISVCVCTYKRPQMLSTLLSKLQDQVTENLFTYSAVVVDNDSNQSAKGIVTDWQARSTIQINYHCEPEQNIALARNKAVENAKGKLIAFIDDDEFPENTWLINLLNTQNQYKATGVLGPVKPYFEVEPPRWIIKGRICDRVSFPTGTMLKNQKKTRTGNVLLSKESLRDQEMPFNPEFGRTGGEDVDFFHRMMTRGFTFVWCNEACVYEIVPQDRFKRIFYLKKALLRGKVNADKSSAFSMGTIKSAIAVISYTAALPFFLLFGQHLFMKYLIKDCDHIGKLLGIFGIAFIRERNF
jgi:succinoglycan biosynthesis protein ExoM